LALILVSCGNTATILRRDGSRVEAEIRGGTRTELAVRERGGLDLTIPRQDVRTIRHPGGGLVVGGIALAIAGAVMLLTVKPSTDNDLVGASLFAPSVLGLLLAGRGYQLGERSREAAAADSRP